MDPQQQWELTDGSASGGAGIYLPDIDLSDFTEVDPNSHISISTTKATASGLTRTEDAYVYDDLGADAVSGNFEFLFEIGGTGSFATNGIVSFVGLGDQVDDIKNVSNSIYTLIYKDSGGTLSAYVREVVSGSQSQALATITAGQTYYCKLVRDESIGTYGRVSFYLATTSANRDSETWAVTITLDLTAQLDLQYIYAMSSQNLGGTAYPTGAYVDHITFSAD